MSNRSANRIRRVAVRTTAALALAAVAVTGCGGGESSDGAATVAGQSNTRPSVTQELTNTDTGNLASDQSVKVRAMHRYGEVATSNGTTNWATMSEFLAFTLHDADAYWTSEFVAAGLPEPMVTYAFPATGEQYQTKCGPSDDSSMFYCPADDTIVFSQEIATRLWNGTYVGPDGQSLYAPGGDFSVAFLVAHEVGHSIQAELGIGTDYSVPRREKHADCLSGMWARSAESRNLLDPGDIEEGIAGAFLVGDSQFENPQHHGTPQQRMDAFTTGYSTGNFNTCNTYLTA